MTALALAASTLLAIAIPVTFCALWVAVGAWIKHTNQRSHR